MSESTTAYLAGVLDSDGCVSLGSYRTRNGSIDYRVQVVISKTDQEFLQWVQATLDYGSINYQENADSAYPSCYQWRVSQAKAETFLRMVLPYLRVKKRKAELALRLRELMLPVGGRGSPLSEDLKFLRDAVLREFKRLDDA